MYDFFINRYSIGFWYNCNIFLLVSNYIWYKSSKDLNYTTSLISSYIVFASLIVNCIIWTMFTMNFVEMHINTPFRLF